MSGCDSKDSDGRRLLTSGSWNSGTNLTVQGGQGMHFNISNANVLGTTITIAANSGESHSTIITPLGSADLQFSIFGNEPMGWTFNISTNSDAFIVTWCLYSTWIPGDPPNPPVLASVQSVNPSAGQAGSMVTISGRNFAGVTDVTFGSASAAIQSSSDTEITVTAPNGGGTVDVVVVNGAGPSNTRPADQFTYTTPAVPPVVTGINPTSGSAGTSVTIAGVGFTDVTDVGFGLANVNVLSAIDTQIVVNAPGGDSGTTVDITV